MHGGPEMLLIPVFLLVGIAYCFFGYRIVKIILAILGFVTGGAAGGALGAIVGGAGMGSQEAAVLFAVVGVLLGGIIGAVLFVLLYFVGIFLLGFGLGAMLTAAVFAAAGTNPDQVVGIVAIVGIAGGVLALFLQRIIIILSTATSGAAMIVMAVLLLFGAKLDVHPHQGQTLASVLGPLSAVIPFVCWLALSAAGVVVQFLVTGKTGQVPPPAAVQVYPQTLLVQPRQVVPITRPPAPSGPPAP